MKKSDKVPKPVETSSELEKKGDVDQFLAHLDKVPRVGKAGRGRIIFALDATASRQPTWDIASHIQAEMFTTAESLGGLDVQLVYYRGFGECKASGWVSSGKALLNAMLNVTCLAGRTQIGRVLRHALKQTRTQKVHALIFIGDAMEEDLDHLGELAGQLGLQGTPVFLFHEGSNPYSRAAFAQLAKLSGGACCQFDPNSAQQLKDLLAAVAVYATGGKTALKKYSRVQGGNVLLLSNQVNR